MRDLNELGLNDGTGKPETREPPNDEQIRAFETHFGITLPDDYLALLRHSNGAHPELDCFQAIDAEEGDLWNVNDFHFLNADREDTGSLWWNALAMQSVLPPRVIPIADNGGGDSLVLNCNHEPPMVQMCFHEEGFDLLDVAYSFGEFIDLLQMDPDVLEEEENE